jgi:hypothetical protein
MIAVDTSLIFERPFVFAGAVARAFASAFIRHGRMYLYYIYHDIKTYICNSNLFETIIKYYEG